MFEKGKRERRQNEDDRTFNRMLIWLGGAVVVELLLLLLQKAYVDILWDAGIAAGLTAFFKVFTIAGLVIAVGCAAWGFVGARGGKNILLPAAIGAAAVGLWLISVMSLYLYPNGVRILMMFPAAGAVLIIIFFLYQRSFFYNAILTGGGMLAMWLHGQYYMTHPRLITACVIGGVVVLAAVAALSFQVKKNDGKLGSLRVLPPSSDYMMTWLTCGITAVAMIVGLVLGVSLSHYVLYVLVGWLFAQAVFFTVKMM